MLTGDAWFCNVTSLHECFDLGWCKLTIVREGLEMHSRSGRLLTGDERFWGSQLVWAQNSAVAFVEVSSERLWHCCHDRGFDQSYPGSCRIRGMDMSDWPASALRPTRTYIVLCIYKRAAAQKATRWRVAVDSVSHNEWRSRWLWDDIRHRTTP